MLEIPFNAGPLKEVLGGPHSLFRMNGEPKTEIRKYAFNEQFGEGSWEPYFIDDGFEMSILKGKVKKHITFHKMEYPPEGFFDIIFCDAPKFEQVNDLNQIEVFGVNANKSAIFSNAKMKVSYIFPVDVKFNWIVMRFYKGYIKKYIDDVDANYLTQLVQSNKPFLVHEHVDIDMDLVLQQMLEATESTMYRNQKVRAYALSLVNFFFERLEARRKQLSQTRVRTADYEKSFQIRESLLANLGNPPTIQTLAEDFGMSSSKLKALFKQVFGKTIYQYYQEYRMEQARQLMNTKDLNVSEVGYQVGYSNLSHFSEAFKKQFGILPKQYMLEARQNKVRKFAS